MIDTDKYEGHTQGHWATTTRKGTWVVYTQDNGDVATMNDYEDAKLIADAPLFLAEVKRLTKTLELIGKHMPHDPWMHTLIRDVIGYEKEMIE